METLTLLGEEPRKKVFYHVKAETNYHQLSIRLLLLKYSG